jgi:hypothetical protein
VSLLKKVIKPTDQVMGDILVSLINLASQEKPLQIVEEGMIKRGCKLQPQVRVQRDILPDICSTWENLYSLVDAFPDTPAWGQASLRGEDTRLKMAQQGA